MSILIRGLEMPTAGMCKTITIFDNGAVVVANGSEKLGIAVSIPPHGRLIDADALDYSLGIEDRDDYVHWTLDTAPTIIPADQVKEKT